MINFSVAVFSDFTSVKSVKLCMMVLHFLGLCKHGKCQTLHDDITHRASPVH